LRPAASSVADSVKASTPTTAPASAPALAPSAEKPVAVGHARQASAYVPLRIGDTETVIRVEGTSREIAGARHAAIEAVERAADAGESAFAAAPDLELIVKRCRLKSSACLAFMAKRASDPESQPRAEAIERIRTLLPQARALQGCFLWMLFPDREMDQPDDPLMTEIAASYDNVARIAEPMERVKALDAGGSHHRRAVELLAEAQSALRAAIDDTWLTRPDADQQDAYDWLRNETRTYSIYLDRFMRVDEPADPSQHADLADRIAEFEREFTSFERSARDRRKLIDKLRYHAKRLRDADAADAPGHWQSMSVAAAELARAGVSPSSQQIQSILRDHPPPTPAPEDLSAELTAAMRKASSRAGDPEHADTSPEYSATVRQVRDRLRGRRAVIFGGTVYDHAKRRLVDAFELLDLDWISISEHGSSEPLRAPIQRSDTAVVLGLVKLAGHQHIEDARAWSRDADKPFVMLRAGYNPEQVAAAINEQASERV
jgi:hypothetical protein